MSTRINCVSISSRSDRATPESLGTYTHTYAHTSGKTSIHSASEASYRFEMPLQALHIKRRRPSIPSR
jgi:hypothetical protein